MNPDLLDDILKENRKQTRYLKEIHNLIGFAIVLGGILYVISSFVLR